MSTTKFNQSTFRRNITKKQAMINEDAYKSYVKLVFKIIHFTDLPRLPYDMKRRTQSPLITPSYFIVFNL